MPWLGSLCFGLGQDTKALRDGVGLGDWVGRGGGGVKFAMD